MACPLCSIATRAWERIYYSDASFTVVRTLNRKGHRERVMIVLNEHRDWVTPEEYADAMRILEGLVPELFAYTYKVVAMDGLYGSIKDHWHLVLTDLEEGSEDHRQCLGTPWLRVFEVKPWLES